MKRTPGLYVTLLKDGKIKRTLVTNKGETILEETTIGAELIWYAELDYSTYISSLRKIEELSEKTEDDGAPENYGTVYLDTFDELLTETNELVYDITRLRYVNNEPLRMEYLLIPQKYFPELQIDDLEDSLYEYIYIQTK